MNKTLSVATICLAVAVVILALALVRNKATTISLPKFDTQYQAVLLDNGLSYYGKISGLGTPFPKMTDAFYIQNVEDPKTKAVKHVLVKRGKELHAPTETFLDARHIVMIEPVGPSSEVAQLIAKYQSQASSQPQ